MRLSIHHPHCTKHWLVVSAMLARVLKHPPTQSVTHLWRDHFDELVEKSEFAELLMEPLSPVLHTCLQELCVGRGEGRGERGEGRREDVIERCHRATSTLTVKLKRDTFSLESLIFGTMILNAICGLKETKKI